MLTLIKKFDVSLFPFTRCHELICASITEQTMSGLSQSKEDCSFEFPPDWGDDARMAFLFSAFKENRDVDSTDWDGKMDFWTPLIINHCRRRGAVCVNLHELNESFRRKGSAPLGLGIVLQFMYR